MITRDELDQLRARVARLSGKLEVKGGAGFSQAHTLADGSTHRYHVKGVKQIEEFEDELHAVFVWAWSIKDYLKELATHNGKDAAGIEDIVNDHVELQILSDVANGTKHGTLNKSRSGHFARLDRPMLVVPQEAMSGMTFEAYDVTIDVSNPEKTRFEVVIRSRGGEVLGEAAEILRSALSIWESEGIPYAVGASGSCAAPR